MDKEIDRRPTRAQLVEGRIKRRIVGDIDVDHEIRPDTGGQRFQTFAECLALIGESQLSPRRRHRLGNSPRDGAFVRDTHDQAAFALHLSGHVQSKYFDKSIDPFVPPNPKELVITVSSPAFSTSLVAISSGLSAGSSVSTLIDGMMKSSRSASKQ